MLKTPATTKSTLLAAFSAPEVVSVDPVATGELAAAADGCESTGTGTATEGNIAVGEGRNDVSVSETCVGVEVVVLSGPTRKKFPATGWPKDVLLAKFVRLKFILNEVSVGSLPIVPLKNASAEVLKLSGWT